ncbi:MAG TPA: GAF domain-containing protein [Candidatus Pacearchaeota archaeon]|jgi:GAF domain-containing protein|nr:GAF domain-containing protein [Candidatus Pacearchaeota archaeon]
MDSDNLSNDLNQDSSLTKIFSSDEKIEFYNRALEEIKERVNEIDSLVSKMATVASVLRTHLPYYFWCGFYFAEEDEMVIGPYQGSTACANIGYQGVCGTAAKKKESIIVPNVHEFPGHIVCDERSNSEIVVPLIGENDIVIAVLDIDSTKLKAFDDVDKDFLEKELMPILLNSH